MLRLHYGDAILQGVFGNDDTTVLPEWLKFNFRSPTEAACYEQSTFQDPTGYIRRLGEILRAGKAADAGGDSGAGEKDWGNLATNRFLLASGILFEFDAENFEEISPTLHSLGRFEHEVFHPENTDTVYKIALPRILSDSDKIIHYLDRLVYLNEKLYTGYRLLGVMPDPFGEYGLVISQPWVPNARHATQEEIDTYFTSKGFLKYIPSVFVDVENNILLKDIDPSNVLTVEHPLDEDGYAVITIHPVDVIPEWTTEERIARIKSHIDKRSRIS